MKIIAIPATNTPDGINRQLIDHAARRIESGLVDNAVVEIVDLNDYEMPIYSMAREAADGVPTAARTLRDKIGAADAVLISFAEHNGSYTAAWKNTFDWMSRLGQDVYQGKPVAMLAASPGPRAGAAVLASASQAAPFFDGNVVGTLGVGSFHDNFDAEVGALTDDELTAELDQLVGSLAG